MDTDIHVLAFFGLVISVLNFPQPPSSFRVTCLYMANPKSPSQTPSSVVLLHCGDTEGSWERWVQYARNVSQEQVCSGKGNCEGDSICSGKVSSHLYWAAGISKDAGGKITLY